MTTNKRRLPLAVERTVSDIHALRIEAQAEFDGKLREQGAKTSCSPGCSACCHYPFFISVAEGILLYRHLSKSGLWTPSLKKRVQDARNQTLGASFKVWLMSNLPCPLLDGGMCLGYSVRPLQCRVVVAVSDPAFCHPHQLGDRTQQIDRSEVIERFTAKTKPLLKRHHLKGIMVPLSEALLAGESVVTGELPIETIEKQFLFDFAKAAHGNIT